MSEEATGASGDQSHADDSRATEDTASLLDDVRSMLGLNETDRWLEIAAAAVLSIAVVLTAFSAWQATLWGGEQSEAFAEAAGERGQANAALSLGLTAESFDVTIFSLGMQSFLTGQEEASRFFAERLVRDEFQPALDAWIAQDPQNNPEAADTPFEMPEYTNENLEEAQRFSERAETRFEEGREANKHEDNYYLAAVFMAAVLFFTGIASKFKSQYVRIVTLVIAGVALSGATAFLITLPRIFRA